MAVPLPAWHCTQNSCWSCIMNRSKLPDAIRKFYRDKNNCKGPPLALLQGFSGGAAELVEEGLAADAEDTGNP